MTVLFRVSVPMPPSVNSAYANVSGKGRVRSKAYRSWAEEAGWMVKAKRQGLITETVAVTIEICPSTKRLMDLDNRCKPALDLLVSCGVLPDDNNRYIKRITIMEVGEGPECTITVESF